jgi:flagellar protein FlgJ
VRDWFRKYNTPEESFTDHAQFFFRNKRYAKALLVKEDPREFARRVAAAGYATDPNYATLLVVMIDKIEVVISKIPKL